MNKSKAKIALTGRTLCVALMAAFAVSLGAQFAAAGDNFLTDLGGYLDEIRGALVALAPAVAGLAWVIAKIWQIIMGVSADGEFGSMTHNATIQFQGAHGLEQDGEVGPNTWSAGLKQV